MKVPYVEDNPEKGGLGESSDAAIVQMIRDGVQSWQPKRGADWSGLLMRVSAGPSPWVTYAVSTAALVIILISAFLLGSALHVGALAPQPIQSHLP